MVGANVAILSGGAQALTAAALTPSKVSSGPGILGTG